MKKIKKKIKSAKATIKQTIDTILCTSVFDHAARNILGPSDHIISLFDYLNNSDRIEAERVRNAVDKLWKRYPWRHKLALRHRLRSRDDTTHLSTFFELMLHDFLIKSGCRRIKIEPVIEGTSKRPDFSAIAPDGTKFYLEVKMTNAQSQAESSAQQRISEAFQAIDSIASPDFFLSLSTAGMPSASIKTKQLKHQLKNWIQKLNYEEVDRMWDTGAGVLPTFRYEEHGWRIHIQPVPRGSSRGSTLPSRAIASRMLNPLTVQPQEPLKSAIQEKATRYGDIDFPFIIAVNTLDQYAREDSIIDALFGSPGVTFTQTAAGYRHEETRSPDGIWRNRSGPINTRVSAVLSTERLTPWSLGKRRLRMIANPWAKKSISSPFRNIDQYQVVEERLVFQQGKSLQEIFDLHTGWPE